MQLWYFFLGGGWGMFFVLAFALVTLAQALSFALRPDLGRRAALDALSRATVCSAIGTVCLNLAAVGSRVPAKLGWESTPTLPLIVMEGIAESLAPAIMAFAFLALTWMLAAVGHRRLASDVS
jgi:hypothetical protein